MAFAPIPTPQQIAWQIQQEQGRQATYEEVNAVHQMLTRQRNEALVGVGLIIGAPFVAHEIWKK